MRRLLQAALLALALAVVPATASAAVVQNITMPISRTLLNPCTNDVVTVSGNFHLVISSTADGSGGFHMTFMDNVSGVTGVGVPSGVTYHGVGGDWFAGNIHPPFPNEFTFTDVFGIISTGSSPNLFATDTIHFTVDANGTVTAQVVKFTLACR
jgi:hypothetical protein